MSKVFICTPHARPVEPSVTRHLLTMLQQPEVVGKHEFLFSEVDSFVVGKARNMIVESTNLHEADVLLWVDDDILVPAHAHRLIDGALDRGIMSGIYVARNSPYTPQMYKYAEGDKIKEEYKDRKVYWPILEWDEENIFEVDAIGFGLCAIRRDVFDTMAKFHAGLFEEASNILYHEGIGDTLDHIAEIVRNLSPWFEFLNSKGEDMYWSERAKEADFKLWVDPKVSAGHIGSTPLVLEHFFYLRDNGLIQQEEDGQVVLLEEPPAEVEEEVLT